MSQSADNYHISGLALTLAFVTAAIMITTGVIMAFYGGWELLFGGVERDSETIINLRARTWGIVHFALGVGIVGAGASLFSGKSWGRIVAIIMAGIVLLAGLATLPDSPVWSMFLIVLNAGILWALLMHGRDLAEVTS